MKNIHIHKGFALIQLMVVLLTLSIILAATSPMITKGHKKIPLRANHGKYICYWDGENLVEEYYNSRTRISRTNVEACTFESPSKVVNYKVELIGGGAGGNYYKEINDTLGTRRDGVFDLRSGYSGNYVKKPGDNVLRMVFDGVTLTYCSPTGNGTTGNSIRYYKYPIALSKCMGTDSQGNTKEMHLYDRFLEGYLNQHGSQGIVYGPVGDKLFSECKKIVETHNFLNPELRTSSETRVVNGFEGSPNTYLRYDYPIILNKNDKNIAEKLNNNIKYIKAGSWKNGKFEEKTITTINDEPHTEVIDFKTDLDDDDSYTANPGQTQDAKAAIRISANKYKVLEKAAEGGMGAKIEFDDVTGKFKENSGNSKRHPIVETVPICTEYIPKLNIKTQINQRVYKYGLGGRHGKYDTYNFGNLKSCSVTAGKGGSAGTQSHNLGGSGGESSISCSDLNIKLTASGGSALSANYFTSETKDLYDEVISKGDLKANLSNYTTKKQIGLSSGYKSDNFFINFKNFPKIEFGKGGDGNTITDKRLDAWGSIKYYLDNTLKNSETKNQEFDVYDIEDAATTENPTPGNTGAVIITW